MKNSSKLFSMLLISTSMVLSVFLSGCTNDNQSSNKAADVILKGLSHHETYELPMHYISTIFLNLKNTGTITADDVQIHIIIDDNNGNVVYNKDVNVSSSLGPEQETVQSLNVPYDIGDRQLDMNLSIKWNNGVNYYTEAIKPEFKEYADVVLESVTHHENYTVSDGYTTTVNFSLQNKGDLIAENVEIIVEVRDDRGNEQYNDVAYVAPLLLPWEVKSYNIIMPYDFDDERLDFNITVSCFGAMNHYTRSIEPEFIALANVTLENMIHFEHHKLFVGYVSTIGLILQNKGNALAENIEMHVIATDNYGKEEYDEEEPVISFLVPGEIINHEIEMPFNFFDTNINLNITISWKDGVNYYLKSFQPKIIF